MNRKGAELDEVAHFGIRINLVREIETKESPDSSDRGQGLYKVDNPEDTSEI